MTALTRETWITPLLAYRELGPPVAGSRLVERRVWYTHLTSGHVSHITVEEDGPVTASRKITTPRPCAERAVRSMHTLD